MDRIIVEDKLGAYEALIDSEDRDLIAGFVWRPLRTDSDVVYAQASRRRITVDGRSKHLGRFRSELEAAKAYDAAALARWGEFAILNFEDL